MGAITKILISLSESVSMGYPNADNEVVVSNSDDWVDIPFIMESASLSEAEKQVDAGALYEISAVWSVPRVDALNFAVAHKFIDKPVVILFTSANGTQLVVGSPTVPAYITIKKSVPKETSGLNAYHFSVKYRNPRPVCFVG